jgi:hypothetical protein
MAADHPRPPSRRFNPRAERSRRSRSRPARPFRRMRRRRRSTSRWTILVRRSHTLGNEVMQTTKTGSRQRITVPQELLDVLQWHVRHATRHAGAKSIRASLRTRRRRLPHRVVSEESVRRRRRSHRLEEEFHAARNATNAQRHVQSRQGREPGHQIDFRAPDGPYEGPLLDGLTGGATRQHRPCPSSRATDEQPPEHHRKWCSKWCSDRPSGAPAKELTT